jgi:hypothetical protein
LGKELRRGGADLKSAGSVGDFEEGRVGARTTQIGATDGEAMDNRDAGGARSTDQSGQQRDHRLRRIDQRRPQREIAYGTALAFVRDDGGGHMLIESVAPKTLKT